VYLYTLSATRSHPQNLAAHNRRELQAIGVSSIGSRTGGTVGLLGSRGRIHGEEATDVFCGIQGQGGDGGDPGRLRFRDLLLDLQRAVEPTLGITDTLLTQFAAGQQLATI
jgi:hypothetical protein